MFLKGRTRSISMAAALFSVFGLGAWWGGVKTFDTLLFDVRGFFSKINTQNATAEGLEALKERVNASIRYACKEATIDQSARQSSQYYSNEKLKKLVEGIELFIDEMPTQVSPESLKNTKDFLVAVLNSSIKEKTERKAFRMVDRYQKAMLLNDLERFFLSDGGSGQTRSVLEAKRDQFISESFSACKAKQEEIYKHSGYPAIPNSASSSVPENMREYCVICYKNFYPKNEQPEKYNFVPEFGCSSGILHIFCKECTDRLIADHGTHAKCPLCRASRLS